MTREAFIKKWLGNRDYNYCEEHKDLMRDDLDSVLEFHQQQVKSVDLADVGERYLAIGTLASGKSFRYEDNAVDIRAFANYINEIYPDFEVDAIIAT